MNNKKMEDFVNVSVRIKPSPIEEINSCLQVINKNPAVLLAVDRGQTYHFDNIFTPNVKQEDVYDETVKPLVENVKAGYNCTVFAYGQTGTGKTYTIGTNPNIANDKEAGLISRTLEDFFCHANEDNDVIDISFIEIYNEKVFDLLAAQSKGPLLVKGFAAQGFEKVRVHNTFEALLYLRNGSKNRHIGETKQNLNSSRSHAIFSIYCESTNSVGETKAKLNLVDLAGSESVRKTGNQGSSFYEGININKGLLSLGQVMTALSTNSTHIPYRQSIVTTILQDSLNKRNFVSLIACVSSSSDDIGETLQTLEFSNRVKKMKNKPEVNQFITQYKTNNPNLFPTCPSRGLTPLKRSNGYSQETPYKKMKNVLPMVPEPVSINSSNFEPSPLFSSSMTSVISDSQQNFSPVIKKYINAMESSIINKLEDVIKNTLKKSRNRISRQEEKENFATPCTTWNPATKDTADNSLEAIIQEDSPGTRSPNAQLSFTRKNISPKDKLQIFTSKKCLIFEMNDSPSLSPVEAKSTTRNDDSIFKVPAPKSKPLKVINTNSVRRSSVRLQMKKREPEIPMQDRNRRRSVRLQMKNPTISNTDTDDITSKTPNKRQPKSLNVYSPCFNCSVKKTALKKSKESSKDSPVTLRKKQILNILNNGSLREIEKLHTVGTKTAEKIKIFRELKGKFSSIADVANMPSWTQKKYEKFLAENFLT